MAQVYMPHEMNQAFAHAFNTRDINNIMALYEENAVLRIDSKETFIGKASIAVELRKLLRLPGSMLSQNNFCIEHGDIALLRADHSIIGTGREVIFFWQLRRGCAPTARRNLAIYYRSCHGRYTAAC